MDEGIIKEIEKFGSIIEIEGNKIKLIFHEDPDLSIQKIKQALKEQDLIIKISRDSDYYYIELFKFKVPPNNYVMPLILFLLTLFTTLVAGALQQGYVPWQNWRYLFKGLPFSISLLLILGLHELGHYIVSRKSGVASTLPHFIPAPNPLLGTLGAFIRIKSPITDRKALIRIGAAGPIMSFLTSIPVTIIGLSLSKVMEYKEGLIALGNPLIFQLLSYATVGKVPQNQALVLHPMAFAGWIGFFVTALNLLPVGQLDGGHILFGILGKKAHNIISRVITLILIPLGFLWSGWWVWGILLIILGTRHPEPLYSEEKLPLSCNVLSALSLIIFILCFTPTPIKVVP
ncbi:MAG: site-2 protease family protein [Candidatus Hydrothermia bacterium]|jgi:membrane-associated protease RseP (regulator of RpoE activity)